MPSTETREMIDELRALEKPVLVRALVCLVFGLITIVWQPSNFWSWGDPGLLATTLSIGVFMVATGGILVLTQRNLNQRVYREPGTDRAVLQSIGILYLVGGLSMIFVRDISQLVLIVGLIYSLAGLTEMLLGLRKSGDGREPVMAKDWKIAGAVALLVGIGLFFFGDMGDKAVFGIVGGGAMITGIFQLLAALTFRHDAREVEKQPLP